jgi:hypothetical protein
MYQCMLTATDGMFNSCNTTPTSGSPSWSPNGVALALASNALYAYVADNNGYVYYCSLNLDGTFNTCNNTPASTPFWTPLSVSFATVGNGTQYAYIASGSNSTLYQCTLNNINGTFTTCNPTPTPTPQIWSVPKGTGFASINSIQYGYVADVSGYVYKCTVSQTDGTFNNCINAFINTFGALGNPSAIAFPFSDNPSYAYVAGGNGYGVYICTLNNNDGMFDTWVLSNPVPPVAWAPIGVTVATVNGIPYVYVASDDNLMHRCTIDNTNGHLKVCKVTPSSGISWDPGGAVITTTM